MPKAKPYPEGEEEEKTTIESQWEDEASTTVEQGEVADKVRALGNNPQVPKHNTNITHTGAVDELTVDDQHAPNLNLSAITPLRADQNARLSITQGNDTGQSFEIRPGKSYTIGRAIDNDVVLTDIAVSRKHFDLRHDDGAWVIVDHGSGNGTVVNGNVEDNPFMLANGDVIEIGNTVFRFEQDQGPERPVQQPQRTMDIEDDEELSTVAGKPLRPELNEIDPIPTPVAPPRMQPRPKTLPPPTPLRPVGASQPPPLGMPPLSPASLAQQQHMAPQPASTLPLPQMANRPPPLGTAAPTLLGDSMGMPQQMQHNMQQPGMPMGSMVPTTIPGQGGPQRPPVYPYPQAAEIPPHSVHAQMLLIQTQNRRGDHSTAHVPPMSYGEMMNMGPGGQRYSQPQLSQRTKYILGGAALAVLAAVATIAIVKSTRSSHSVAKTETRKPDPKNNTVVPLTPDPPKQQAKVDPIKVDAISPAPKPDPKQEAAKQEAAKQEAAKEEAAKQEAAKQEAAKQEAAKQQAAKEEAANKAKDEAARQQASKEAKQQAKEEAAAKQQAAREEAARKQAARDAAKEAARQAKEEAAARAREKMEAARNDTKKRDNKTTTTTANKTVGTADVEGAKSKADSLYRSRKFNDAASVLNAAAKSADEDEASSLKTKALTYISLGKALNVAEAPASDYVVAWNSVRAAATYDGQAGGNFKSDIRDLMKTIAPKAAISLVSKKNYQLARNAVIDAEQNGNADGVSLVRQKLDTVARDLYNDAAPDFSSTSSKEKLNQILQITDAKSPWNTKARKALGK